MMNSTTYLHTNNFDDAIVEAQRSRVVGSLVTLDYPSLIDSCWDDELLPSGD